jgi:hypothetical protein
MKKQPQGRGIRAEFDNGRETVRHQRVGSPIKCCSFCGKSPPDVARLCHGATGNICNDCVELAYAIVGNAVHDASSAASHQNDGFDVLLPFLERMRADGAVVVLKIDGERGPGDAPPCMAIVSKGRLGADPIVVHGPSLVPVVAELVQQYAKRFWGA